jgi:hypothetical protein
VTLSWTPTVVAVGPRQGLSAPARPAFEMLCSSVGPLCHRCEQAWGKRGVGRKACALLGGWRAARWMDARLPVVVWCGNITQKSAFLFDPCTPRNPLPVFLLLRALLLLVL